MALALLKLKNVIGNVAEFELDIGTNKFYKLKIGKNKINTQGLELIDEIVYETPLSKGPDFNAFNSRFPLVIPTDKFNSQSKYAQLFSFKDSRKKSPAVSKVVDVFRDLNLLKEDLPRMTSPLNLTMINQNRSINNTRLSGARAVGFSFEEASLSTPMFWDALIEAARVLTPSAVNALVSLIGGGSGQSANNENTVRVINAILEALKQSQTSAGAASNLATAPTTPASSATSVSISQTYPDDYLPFQRRIFRENEYPASNRFLQHQYVEPSLLPLLGPGMQNLQLLELLFQQAPQLLQILVDNPMKLMNILTEGIGQLGKLQSQKKIMDQLRVENSFGEAARNSLFLQHILRCAANAFPIESSSNSLSPSREVGFSITYNELKSTAVIEKGISITVNGKPKYVYLGTRSIRLLVHINIVEGLKNEKMAKVIIDLSIKDPSTLKMLLEKSFKLKDVSANSMQELELLSTEIRNLPRNTDLLVSVTSRCLGAGDKSYTCGGDMHLIFIVNDYFYKGIGNKIGSPIPLDDRTRYRVFWNKIWEGGTKKKKRWEIDLTAKYYIYYRYDQSANGRIETKIQQIQPESESERDLKIEGKMKSGLEITPDELNKLLPSVSSNNPLEEAKLQAFKTDELEKDYNSEALTSFKMKGKTDETGIIWTYPEIGLFEFLINNVSRVDQNGQVAEIKEAKIIFPKPISIHFVGEKTAGNNNASSTEDEGTNIGDDTNSEGDTNRKDVKASKAEGYGNVFDINVELRPVELAPININIKK